MRGSGLSGRQSQLPTGAGVVWRPDESLFAAMPATADDGWIGAEKGDLGVDEIRVGSQGLWANYVLSVGQVIRY